MTYNTKAYAAPSATERLRPFTLSRREVGAHRPGLVAAGALVWLALGLGAVVSASGAAADPNLYPFGEPSGSVATLQSPRGRLAGCSSWPLRFAVYSSGGNLNRK